MSSWIPERLDEPDVPVELLIAFLRRIRSRTGGQEVLRERVVHRLGSDRLLDRDIGVELVRRLQIGRSTAVAHCRCTAGISRCNRLLNSHAAPCRFNHSPHSTSDAASVTPVTGMNHGGQLTPMALDSQ